MKQLDLEPSEWTSEKPRPMSTWEQMREASRTYEPPPMTAGTWVWLVVVFTALYCARHGFEWIKGPW